MAIKPGMTIERATFTRSVRFEEGALVEEYRIVENGEADVRRRQMSAECPVGRALLGRQVGERVRVRTPGGAWTVRVLEVR